MDDIASALGPSGPGYTLVRNVIDDATVAEAVEALTAAAASTPYEERGFTKRVLDILDLDAALFGAILAALPTSGAAPILGARFRVGSYHAHVALPASAASEQAVDDFNDFAVHIDYPFWLEDGVPHGDGTDPTSSDPPSTIHPDAPLTVQLLVMLSPFTPESGATRIVPRSHTLRRLPERVPRPPGTRRGRPVLSERDAAVWADARPVCGNAGDIIVYSGQAWHGTGVNTTDVPRWALLVQLLPYYYAPMEPLVRMLTPTHTAALPPAAHTLLGLDRPFDFPRRVRPRSFSRTLAWSLASLPPLLTAAVVVTAASAVATTAYAAGVRDIRSPRAASLALSTVAATALSAAAYVTGAHAAFRSVGL